MDIEIEGGKTSEIETTDMATEEKKLKNEKPTKVISNETTRSELDLSSCKDTDLMSFNITLNESYIATTDIETRDKQEKYPFQLKKSKRSRSATNLNSIFIPVAND